MNRDLTPDEVESLIHDSKDPAQAVLPMPSVSGETVEPNDVGDETVLESHLTGGTVEQIFVAAWQKWSEVLASPLRTQPICGPTEVRPGDWEAVRRELRPPVCIQVLRSAACHVVLILESDLLYAIIERLLGGGKHPVPKIRRPLTDIEAALFERATRPLMDAVNGHLRPIAQWRQPNVETSVDGVPAWPSDSLVQVQTSIKVAETDGVARCILPSMLLREFQSASVTESRVAKSLPGRGLSVVAGHLKLRRDELHDLKVGDTLFAHSSSARVYVDRTQMYGCRLGIEGDQKAVGIEADADERPNE